MDSKPLTDGPARHPEPPLRPAFGLTRRSRLALLATLIVPSVAVDQATKALATAHLAGQPEIEMLGGLLVLTYAENAGAALSLGEGLPEPYRGWLLTLGIGVILAGVLAYTVLRRDVSRGEVIASGLLLGGGIGNLIDRLTNDGRVVDFAIMGVGPVHTGVFNVADMLILAGVLALFVLINRRPDAVPAGR